MNYYNEIDDKAAAWLRELVSQKLIPAGDVDTRSIAEVKAHELKGYTQCHFFAGIAGWPLALQLAGWPADRPVWTGSCPCQPFSTAGKQLGDKDERHLWPVFFDLIRQCRPEHVFGEQVANAIGKGWLDGVSADLESEGYACGAAVLGAHSVGAPHIRQRLYWVAHSELQHERSTQPHAARTGYVAGMRKADGVAHASSERRQQESRGSPCHEDAHGRERDGTGANRTSITSLQVMVKTITGWSSPTVGDSASARNSTANRKSIPPTGIHAGNTLTDLADICGMTSPSSPAETEKPAAFQLNPYFSAWLMGFPLQWTTCGLLSANSKRK